MIYNKTFVRVPVYLKTVPSFSLGIRYCLNICNYLYSNHNLLNICANYPSDGLYFFEIKDLKKGDQATGETMLFKCQVYLYRTKQIWALSIITRG